MNLCRILMLIPMFFLLGSCNDSTSNSKDLKLYITEHIKIGDSQEKVVAFLDDQNWPYAYAEHTMTYHTRNPDEDQNKGTRHQILLLMDEANSLKDIKINAWHNGL